MPSTRNWHSTSLCYATTVNLSSANCGNPSGLCYTVSGYWSFGDTAGHPFVTATPGNYSPDPHTNAMRLVIAACAALLLAGCATSSKPPAQIKASTSPAVVSTPSSTPSPAPAKPLPAPKPVIIATYSGSGEENTPPFTTPSSWHLSWWYSCASFGQSGNFIVTEYNTDGSLDFNGASVNELGTGEGPVATYVYGDAGSHYLSIDSECSWQVVVVVSG